MTFLKVSDDCRWPGDRMSVRLPGWKSAVCRARALTTVDLPACRQQVSSSWRSRTLQYLQERERKRRAVAPRGNLAARGSSRKRGLPEKQQPTREVIHFRNGDGGANGGEVDGRPLRVGWLTRLLRLSAFVLGLA